MPLKDFKILTFDVVGTLIDFERGMLDYVRKVAPSSPLTDDAFLVAYRNSRASKKSGWYPDDLVRVWNEMAPALGLPHGNGLGEGFRDSVGVWPAFPDSVEALKRLRRNFRLVAMTNAQRWALSAYEKTLGMPFDDSISCDDAKCEKPDPQYFEYARQRIEQRMGFSRAQNLHVAQSQHHDIGVAHSLGITTCWIERRHGMKDNFGGTLSVEKITTPDHHFHTLAQLADAVDAGK